MAKTTKRAKRTPARRKPFDEAAYRARADAADEAWVKQSGLRVYIQMQMLQTAEELARDLGLEGVVERRLNLARDDEKFQAFLARCLAPFGPDAR
jgi:hypothetical protein